MIIFAGMKAFQLKEKPLEVMIHVISWILIFSFPIMFDEWGNKYDMHRILRNGLTPLCSLLTFYVNYLYLIPQLLFKGYSQRFLFLNGLLVLCTGSIIFYGNTTLSTILAADLPHRLLPPPHFQHKWFFFVKDLLVMIFVVCLSTAIKVNIRWRKMEERLIEMEKQKTDAELKNLKNQLNPHFLLNTLNNIYALISFNGEKAQESVLELSKLLRYALYENLSSEVLLSKELEFINNYISLMRIRLSQSVKVNVKLDAGPRPLQIARLLFISLIENAFKHGISPTEDCFIDISVMGHEDGKITCEITNSYFPKNIKDKSGSGIGLDQVQQRLELSYSNQYQWTKGATNNHTTYTSLLTIQSHEL